MSWQTQLEALGIDDSNMPNMIRKAIKDLYSFQSTKEKIEGLLERDDLSDNKREQYEDEVETLEASIEAQEEVIEKKIALWEKNKHVYEANTQKLKAAAQAKKGTKVAKGTPQPESEPAPAPAGVVVTQSVPPQPPQPATDPAPKKKGGFGWIAVGLVVAVLTAGAVIINKDE